MKIIFSISSLGYGGAEKNCCMIANELAKRNHDVAIFNFNTLPTTQKLENNIKIINIPQGKRKKFRRLHQLKFMCNYIKTKKPNVIVSFLFIPNFLSILAGKITGVPVIVSERGDPNQHKSKVGKFIYWFYRFADGVVFQSDGARQCFDKEIQKKSTVIPNPVLLKDNTLSVQYDNVKKSIVHAARFEVKQKRQDIMLKAFSVVAKKHPDYIMDFWGDGPDEEFVRKLAMELGVEDKVAFNGVSNDVLNDISKSEIYVLCSDYEGIPNSLLEAMSIGMPCISTDCSPGGVRMLIDSGEDGLIVPCGDEYSLADAICNFIKNREFAIMCGQNAKKVKDKFEYSKILKAWEEYICSYSKDNYK